MPDDATHLVAAEQHHTLNINYLHHHSHLPALKHDEAMPHLPPDYYYHRHKPRRTLSYLKSTTPYLVVFVLFSVGLVSYSLLSKLYSPAKLQQLGWQAWEPINFELHAHEGGNGTLADLGVPLDVWVGLPSQRG